MVVSPVVVGTPEFETAVRLWRSNSDTLGHMPRGGFEDAARAGHLAVAKDPQGAVGGYVMFRTSSRRADASIAHLCVAPSMRGKGVAEALFEHVKLRVAGCCDIRLKCRRDFEHANRLWQRLGFTAVSDSRGRGRGGVLTTWRYPLAELPLLRRIADADRDDRVEAVIDANVFFDLDEESDGNDESRALVADWLDDFVSLVVTEELLNEIHRRDAIKDRERQRRRAATFPLLHRDTSKEDGLITAIKAVLPSTTANEISDIKQLAMAAAADARFFVTRDTDFLDAADELYAATGGVRIVQPHELVIRFDELRREEEYRPARLFLGPTVTKRLARDGDVEPIALLMHDGQPPPEDLRRTRARLRTFLASPTTFKVTCIALGDSLLAAYVVHEHAGELRVPFFAVQNSVLGRTAARHWGDALVAEAVEKGLRIIRVDDAGERVGDALADLAFEREGQGWVKLAIPSIGEPDALAREVEALRGTHADIGSLAGLISEELGALPVGGDTKRARAATIERALWPAKVVNASLPSFVVPIQPRWAKDLFDVGLAATTLFGADPNLAMNCENVYYRAAAPAVLSAPARVLWYVSRDAAYPDAMAIRACSLIDEVVVGPAKELFRRYQRLGVYKWSDIDGITGGKPQKDIMAFRFSKTERFRRPVPWQEFQDLLTAETGRGSPLASPVQVPEPFFISVYSRGVRDA